MGYGISNTPSDNEYTRDIDGNLISRKAGALIEVLANRKMIDKDVIQTASNIVEEDIYYAATAKTSEDIDHL